MVPQKVSDLIAKVSLNCKMPTETQFWTYASPVTSNYVGYRAEIFEEMPV